MFFYVEKWPWHALWARCNASANKVRLLEYHQKMDRYGHQHHTSSVHCYLSRCQAQGSANIYGNPLWSSHRLKSNFSSVDVPSGCIPVREWPPAAWTQFTNSWNASGWIPGQRGDAHFRALPSLGPDLFFSSSERADAGCPCTNLPQKSVAVCGVDEKTSCTIMYA